MKLGIQACTLDKSGYGRWGTDTYKKLKEHRYSCTDFCMAETDTFLYTSPMNEVSEFLKREKKLADESGIEIFQCHGPWRWPPRDFEEADRNERMEKMKRSIAITAELGCKNWVVHPIMPYGTEEAGTENAEKTLELNLSFMSELLETAKKYDVTICLENMPMLNFSLAKPEKISEVVKNINDEHFKICLDTGHVAVFEELSIGDEVRRLGDEVRVLHVHDNILNRDFHFMPFFGNVDWKGFAAALKDIEFKGSFSLETAPPRKTSDNIFEELCRVLAKIAAEITADI